jgi:hypothetical protein
MDNVAKARGWPDSRHADWIALFASPTDRRALWAFLGTPRAAAG